MSDRLLVCRGCVKDPKAERQTKSLSLVFGHFQSDNSRRFRLSAKRTTWK